MHVVILTAGGAGMFCGSCLQDNALARALMASGEEVSLIPTYTPLTLDTKDESLLGLNRGRVFLGGINLYLKHQSKLWNRLPRWFTRILDSRWALRLSSKLGVSNDAADLGPLTIDLLRGEEGPQRRGIEELVDWIVNRLKPDVVVFSNALLVGPLRELRKAFDGPVWCTLQGDDIFLDALREPHQSAALAMISDRAGDENHGFTGFLTHSEYYADHMADALALPRDRFRTLPLLLEPDGYPEAPPTPQDGDVFSIGYFARICPEKGLHNLVDAVTTLRERRPEVNWKLLAGGYLGPRDKKYYRGLQKRTADWGEAFEYAGAPGTLAEKAAIYRRFDLLSVPTVYREPKGLPVLEGWACGVPCVQPAHGSFPELLQGVPAGRLVPPGDVEALAAAIEELYDAPERRRELGAIGHAGVREFHGPAAVAARFRSIVRPSLVS
ncbi:glycosyltransferase family 4 protein [Alienimonas chondri]|uniref:D-inositol-3-phosphate glycosyltransferase n=1 Tax=Alienimonas chondri TaxID=2681879 RepID=A0ABX1VGU4_9PLAN|nr:glycosyltransferase family 4 protein [Alienimonas chondri]NNJ26011.1 D-inositol-3-phosphate glycosyltransferase [Alienimonas chondri]